jgi:hypothetical protein
MKRIILLLFILIIATGTHLVAQNPIPSYNVPVNLKAYFQEQNNDNSCKQTLGKRTLHVRVSCSGTSVTTCSATVWVYSLDGEDTYGPFTVNGGETLEVEIDEREWGVYVESETPVIVDVWIDEA